MKNSTRGTLFLLLGIGLIYLLAYLANAGSGVTGAWWFEITIVLTVLSIAGSLAASVVNFIHGN